MGRILCASCGGSGEYFYAEESGALHEKTCSTCKGKGLVRYIDPLLDFLPDADEISEDARVIEYNSDLTIKKIWK